MALASWVRSDVVGGASEERISSSAESSSSSLMRWMYPQLGQRHGRLLGGIVGSDVPAAPFRSAARGAYVEEPVGAPSGSRGLRFQAIRTIGVRRSQSER